VVKTPSETAAGASPRGAHVAVVLAKQLTHDVRFAPLVLIDFRLAADRALEPGA
jgi:hypothetical protein